MKTQKKKTSASVKRKRCLDLSTSGEVPSNCPVSVSVSDVVATNCMLSNKFVDLNKPLMEKTDNLLEMQKLQHDEKVENLKLKTIIAEKDSKIMELERTVKGIQEAQCCNDLTYVGYAALLSGMYLSDIFSIKFHDPVVMCFRYMGYQFGNIFDRLISL